MATMRYRKVVHKPTVREWRPVTKRKMKETDMGGEIWVYPGRHVEIRDPETSVEWGMQAQHFADSYELGEADKELMREHYPGVKIE